MLKKFFKYCIIGVILFVLFVAWMFFIQPKNDHKKNLNEKKGHEMFFKSIKHPLNTSEVYYNAFFGNSSGTSNHCEHIIIQIRKYNPEDEKEIADYYKKYYSEVSVSFIKSIDECCGNDDFGYWTVCYGHLFNDQPKLTYESAKDFLPVYVVEYWKDGSNLSDWECN